MSDSAKEKNSEQARVIAGNPEATLRVNNKITSVFRWHNEFQVAMPGTSRHITRDETRLKVC